jgi:3-hydroxyisobutyrate dehydrogenase-like beta-hydroxyacid dehydrogenase
MSHVVAIIAPGQMGSAVGARLVQNGLTVWTVLQGRSAQSAKRAEAAGMIAVAPEEICNAGIILSIVPPGEAELLASQYAPLLRASANKPIYADCNALNPRSVERIAATVTSTGCAFVDAGIIGGPPRDDGYGPVFYLSGEQAQEVAALAAFGLDCRVLDGPIGAASALKMSYAGITKGLTALASMMILAASREGMAAALHGELAASQPALLTWFERQVPSMFGKAYRWVAEMEEIAEFVGDDPAAQAFFQSTARLYERLAADAAGGKRETQALAQFFRDSGG